MGEVVSAGYRPQSIDTDPRIDRLQVERWRAMSSIDKARAVDDLVAAAGRFAVAGLRDREPEASPRELFLRLAALRLDRDTMLRVYGRDPRQDA